MEGRCCLAGAGVTAVQPGGLWLQRLRKVHVHAIRVREPCRCWQVLASAGKRRQVQRFLA